MMPNHDEVVEWLNRQSIEYVAKGEFVVEINDGRIVDYYGEDE